MIASTRILQATNTPTCCAERELLKEASKLLARRGVPPQRMRSRGRGMVRNMTVERARADGSMGCSLPCQACRIELVRWNVRVTCVARDGLCLRVRAYEMDAVCGSGVRCWGGG